MALVATPKIMFMDEASNGVDPISRKNLYLYLKKLKETSTLLITHRIDEAEKICDKIAIMSDGQFLDMDHPNTLKERHGIVYILQVEPTLTNCNNIEALNRLITSTLPFCKRIFAENEIDSDEDHAVHRPRLSYRFDEVEQIGNRGGN